MNEQPHILVVDENEDNGTMMAALLGQIGYAAATTRSVADALKAAHDRPPALYVLDSYFSDGRGTDLCRQLCANDSQATVIFYSCEFDRADFEAALRAGARAYIIKPDIDELLQTIAICMSPVGDSTNQPALYCN
ncbi:MAG: response regulator transcription factor [Blastocatellia bacterium]